LKVVVLGHPSGFLSSQSMPKMVRMIAEGMQARGHQVEIWSAKPVFQRLPAPLAFKKWLGYIDQFLLFSCWIRWRLFREASSTLFAFADQALGPWVSVVNTRPHVIHINDFLAVRSALGEFPQNPTSWTGKLYQNLIRNGLRRGRAFIAISARTREDLVKLACSDLARSEVVYLGLNYPFRPMPVSESHAVLFKEKNLSPPAQGYLLHVGGNQWYKNRAGVLALYEAYVSQTDCPCALWMAGHRPSEKLESLARRVIHKGGDVQFLPDLSDRALCAAYSGARLLVFPSLAEGFGWPIAEALACGCMVLTTGEAPMTEVGGSAAFYIPSQPAEDEADWADEGAREIARILALDSTEVSNRVARGLEQASRFDAESALNSYERIYKKVVDEVCRGQKNADSRQ
jgi:glycosyltransferase involved in cell wall biosynthesis